MRTKWTIFALLAGLFSFASHGLAEENNKDVRRLESVNWDPVKKELTWIVSNGKKAHDGKYLTGQKVTYRIDMDDATMSFNGETRRFSRQEASSVTSLMSLISTYAVESTIWWEKGMGEKVSGGEKVRFDAPTDRCQLPSLAMITLSPAPSGF